MGLNGTNRDVPILFWLTLGGHGKGSQNRECFPCGIALYYFFELRNHINFLHVYANILEQQKAGNIKDHVGRCAICNFFVTIYSL